jgi:hypothetical protein
MKSPCLIILLLLIFTFSGFSQVEQTSGKRILLSGVVQDAATLAPLGHSQIIINRSFGSAGDESGSFSIWVNRRDTIVFSLLGYKPEVLYVSDTLTAPEFIVGVYMNSDTLSIGEVVIIPRLLSLKSEILKAPAAVDPEMENAKYNLKIAAYQGKVTTGSLGDPSSNYSLIRSQLRTIAFEKGGIPSSQMVQLSPLLLIPAAYLLMNGLPEAPAPMKSNLTKKELDQIHKKYLETLKKK